MVWRSDPIPESPTVWRKNSVSIGPQAKLGVALHGFGDAEPGQGQIVRWTTGEASLSLAWLDSYKVASLEIDIADEPGRERYLEELLGLAQALQVEAFLAIDPPRADVRAAFAVSDLVLQLSSKPEAFGRTVLEALAVGKPVLGWAHGGVGELLATHYPQGAVTVGDADALRAAARHLLSDAPAPPLLGDGLAAMQSATLALYESLLDA